jgi:dTDP-4-dehydrorhamnose reductase
MPKIVILGSNGMLGQMAKFYFSQFYEVIYYNERYSLADRDNFIFGVNKINADIIINCIGAIKQKNIPENHMMEVNTFLVGDILNNISSKQILIQPSTDCVFSGKTLNNKNMQNDNPDAIDVYGLSKLFGEKLALSYKNGFVVRSSIIGPDQRKEGAGLFNWFYRLDQGEKINGYSNHFWNGVTTLEWCKQVKENIIEKNNNNFLCLSSNTVSKFELLTMINTIFEKQITVCDYKTKQNHNMSLEGNIACKELSKQLIDIKEVLEGFYEFNKRINL